MGSHSHSLFLPRWTAFSAGPGSCACDLGQVTCFWEPHLPSEDGSACQGSHSTSVSRHRTCHSSTPTCVCPARWRMMPGPPTWPCAERQTVFSCGAKCLQGVGGGGVRERSAGCPAACPHHPGFLSLGFSQWPVLTQLGAVYTAGFPPRSC